MEIDRINEFVGGFESGQSTDEMVRNCRIAALSASSLIPRLPDCLGTRLCLKPRQTELQYITPQSSLTLSFRSSFDTPLPLLVPANTHLPQVCMLSVVLEASSQTKDIHF